MSSTPLFIAHTFPLPVLIVMYALILVIGYVLPLVALRLARMGSRVGAALFAFPSLAYLLFSAGMIISDEAGSWSLKKIGFILLVVVIPIILCLIALGLVIRNIRRTRSELE